MRTAETASGIVKAVVPGYAGSGLRYAPAVKAGPWVFVTGQEAFDPVTGATQAARTPVGAARRQADAVLARIQRLLAEFGADWSQGVRLDQYYSSPGAVDSYHRVRRQRFGQYIPPSTSVVVDRCFAATSSVSAGIVAAAAGEGNAVQPVHPSAGDVAGWQGVAPAVTCGDFVFVSGQMASASGEALDPRAQVPPHMRWGASGIRRQTEHLIAEKLTPVLVAAGSSWEQVVKAQVYLDDVGDLPDFLDVWSEHLGDIPCALTVVPATAFRIVGGLVEINLVALRNEAADRKSVVDVDLPDGAAFGPCVRAGELLFPSGLMGVAADGVVAGSAVSEALDGLAHAGHSQACAIYDYADAVCSAAGTSMGNAVRAQYFVTDVRQFPGIAAAWTRRYSDEPHPFWCVQVPGPLPPSDAVLVADFWMYLPDERRR
jgi:enamine deaminase RidA (YjgF/YER057c/UK114 family)